MPKKSVFEVFGAGASQTSANFTIAKVDLADTGLTVAANNEGADLLIAIVKEAAGSLNETTRDADLDILVSIDLGENDTPNFVTRTVGNTTNTYIRKTITIELDELYQSTGINPNNY